MDVDSLRSEITELKIRLDGMQNLEQRVIALEHKLQSVHVLVQTQRIICGISDRF
jgi:hypothetical protein